MLKDLKLQFRSDYPLIQRIKAHWKMTSFAICALPFSLNSKTLTLKSPSYPLLNVRSDSISTNFKRKSSSVFNCCPNPIRVTPIQCSVSMASSIGKKGLTLFETEEELAISLAKFTSELSSKFTSERGAFTVVISGGSLVKAIRKLTEAPYVNSIEWSKWHVFWVDERVVPKDHADSNYKLAYDGFLSKVPIPPGHVYAINDALPAEGAAEDYETCLKQLVKTGVLQFSSITNYPKFDLMLLGMGPDGHIASLFPGHPLLNEKEHWITFIKDSPKPPPERITFTLPVINSSANITLVATGVGKSDVLLRAFGGDNSSGDLLPVQMIKLDDGELTWFADKEAASKL